MRKVLSWTIWILILITRSSKVNGVDWTELKLGENSGDVKSEYLDFSITSNRVQLRLTQLKDNLNLEFSVDAFFSEQESQSSLKSKLTYSWNTNSGRTNKLFLYDPITEFDQCDETKSELLNSIPSLITIDLNTDYLVEIKGGAQGTFSSATTEPCPAVWTSFSSNRASIKKVKMKLTDEDSGYKLDDHYTIEYRVVAACNPGQYLGDNGCEDCKTDHYGAGVWLDSCTKCPDGKGVEAGKGTKESDCSWKPCDAGQLLEQSTGCQNCPANHWSASGNTAASCTACPGEKEVGPGLGKQESDCTWKSCSQGQYLDQTTGCKDCLQDYWSAGGTVESCTKCPDNKGVAAGAGTSETTCTWKPCAGGQYLDKDKGCSNCEAGHYSAGGTADSCSHCLKNQWSGEKATQCADCLKGTGGVAAGKGTKESDCKDIVWAFEKLVLIRVQTGTIVAGSEGLLVAIATSEVEASTVNVTFCGEGYSNITAKMICTQLGYGDGQFGSSPQNFEYVPESLLSTKNMPILAVNSCGTNYTSISGDCMEKMKENSCELDDTVWIKCAEVIDDRGDSSSTKISTTVLLVIFNIGFALFW